MTISIYDNMLGYALECIERIREDDIRHMMKEGRYPLSENWDLFIDMRQPSGKLYGWTVYLCREKDYSTRVIFRRHYVSTEYKEELLHLAYYVEEIRILVSSFLKELLDDFSWLLKMGYKESDFADFKREFGEDGVFHIYWSGQGIQIFPGKTADFLVTYGYTALRDGVLNTEKGFMSVESLATMNPTLKRFILEGVDDDRA